ncbi:MAG: M48 family metalloprotease [Nitrosarchaeum sp.]|nr:M48 family metalloprotease [Nitrosarchaeum sp.]
MWNTLKTTLLLAALSALIIGIGRMLGPVGLLSSILFALLFNLGAYFLSDKILLKMYQARPATDSHILRTVHELSTLAGIPTPQTYIIPSPASNAFATGRNPAHGKIALTEGILHSLSERELRGVIAHELAHIKHRDILIATIAAVLAAIITNLASMAQWAAFLGIGRDEGDGPGLLELLLLAIVTPLAALLIQLAISRSREYAADARAAHLTRDPEGSPTHSTNSNAQDPAQALKTQTAQQHRSSSPTRSRVHSSRACSARTRRPHDA